MTDDEPLTVLLLSSDLRRRYAEDILTALALPNGATLQFRYGELYVSRALQRAIDNHRVVGASAVLAFVAEQNDPEPFLIPVRYATISAATQIATTYFFQLRIGAYPSLTDYPRAEVELRQRAKPVIQQMVSASGSFYPATTSFPDLGCRDVEDPADRWRGIAERLAVHKTFKHSFFMRVESPVTQSGTQLAFNSDDRLRLVDQQSAKIAVSFYSDTYRPEDGYTLTCRTDGTFLRVSSDDAYDVALRYDAVEFWIHPSVNTFDALAGVTIAMKAESTGAAGSPGTVPAYVRLRVVVQRSRSRLATRALTSGSGAILVAMPAILSDATPLALRIVLAVLGALLLALSSVVLNGPGK